LRNELDTPFESIEGAQEYLRLLAHAVNKTRQEVESDIVAHPEQEQRRLEALRIVAYKLEKLEQHMKNSRRILNDLRSLRRLLFEERRPPASPSRNVSSTSDAVYESELY
jgi:chromosome segregation ATPase